MEHLVLDCHLQNPCELPRQLHFSALDVIVQLQDTLPDSRLEHQDGAQRGPVLVFSRNLGVRMTLGRVIDVWINTALFKRVQYTDYPRAL